MRLHVQASVSLHMRNINIPLIEGAWRRPSLSFEFPEFPLTSNSGAQNLSDLNCTSLELCHALLRPENGSLNLSFLKFTL